jgi:type II secretory ATPase GspE/PulE/Tfp pilus assembly ATPase PilB-like protein
MNSDKMATEEKDVQTRMTSDLGGPLSELRDLGGDTVFTPLVSWCADNGGEVIVLTSGKVLFSRADMRRFNNLKQIVDQRFPRQFPQGLRQAQARQGLIAQLIEGGKAEELLIKQVKQGKTAGDGEELSKARQWLRKIVADAIERRASDIHFEIRDTKALIKFRRFGALQVHEEWPASQARAIAAAAFNFDTDQSDGHLQPTRPQDASMSIDVQVGGRQRSVRLRVGTGPVAVAGVNSMENAPFDMVFRILEQGDSTKVVSLAQLGYLTPQRRLIERAIARPHGLLLVCGKTGSGKTTTLAGCIGMVDHQKKIYTIEDPVEKVLANASQMPVEDSKEETRFAGLVKATMRMDPDVLMVGEVRDTETADNMVRAAITGHLVLSTLHVSGVTKVVPRLENLGIPRGMLANPDVLELLVYQRLVPLLCSCKVPLDLAEYDAEQQHLGRQLLEVIGGQEQAFMKRPGGCSKCDGWGVSGRSVIAEVLPVDDRGREYIQKGDMLGWERDLIARGWQTIADHAIYLVHKGAVDLFDAHEAATFRTKDDKTAIDFRSLYSRLNEK